MTDVDKYVAARFYYTEGVCPGCGSDLEDVAGKADGHRRDGELWYGGSTSNINLCPWTADQLAALVHIGSGMVKYDRGTGGTNRPPAGETAPSREIAPTRLLR